MVKIDVCKRCRKDGIKLFLKGERCNGPKCAVARRVDSNKKPGQRRGLITSEYGKQLKEKQKVKAIYNLSETQLANIFKKSVSEKGSTSEILMSHLERRLDNIVYRLGFSASRAQAKQLVSHGHIKINDKKVDISSCEIKKDDTVSLNSKFELYDSEIPTWLKLDKKNKVGKILNLPARDDLSSEIEEQLIIEFYSR